MSGSPGRGVWEIREPERTDPTRSREKTGQGEREEEGERRARWRRDPCCQGELEERDPKTGQIGKGRQERSGGRRDEGTVGA